jgi:hypothetical protein
MFDEDHDMKHTLSLHKTKLDTDSSDERSVNGRVSWELGGGAGLSLADYQLNRTAAKFTLRR